MEVSMLKTEEETRLQTELEEVNRQIDALKEALQTKPEYGMGEGDPAVTAWELDQAMLKRLQARVVEIQAAMERLAQGTYGLCERCGEAIDPERLAILPDTKLCIRCAQRN